MYYTEEITKPNNAQEGITNFVQMIINNIEAGNTHEALLMAVDLKDDLVNETYQISMQVCEPSKVDASDVNKR